MRKLSFDQFEFDNQSSEESLEVWIAAKSVFPHSDVQQFFTNIVANAEIGIAQPFCESFGYGLIRGYLAKFAGITIPQPCYWPTFVLKHGDTDWDGVFEADGLFIRYHWWTTA